MGLNKKIMFVLACLSLTSCYKKWDCKCTYTTYGNGAPVVSQTNTEIPGFKNEARSGCQSISDTYSYGLSNTIVSCHIN